MALSANPLESPGRFDKIVISGRTNPGLFRLIDGGGRPYKWIINDPVGAQGAILVYVGWKLSDGLKLQFVFWEAAQIAEYYRDFDPILSNDARKLKVKFLDVQHPVLNANGVLQIVIKEKGPLKDLGNQMWSVEVEACEYRKPPRINAVTTPDEPQNRKPTPEDKLDEETLKELDEWGLPLPPRR